MNKQKYGLRMSGMVEAEPRIEENSSPEATASTVENNLQKTNHRLKIITTSTLRADCLELSEQMRCDIGKVVNEILYVGYKSIKALADGNNRAVVSIKDGKINVESFKDKK